MFISIVGVLFFVLIQWPYLSFIKNQLLEEPYIYWFIVWILLTIFLFLFGNYVENND